METETDHSNVVSLYTIAHSDGKCTMYLFEPQQTGDICKSG